MNTGNGLPAMTFFVKAEINFSLLVGIIFTEEYMTDQIFPSEVNTKNFRRMEFYYQQISKFSN
jgi:hypothetical protein